MLKRKIYDELLEWKQKSNGKTAVMIDGARRVGKSFIVEKFAREEYKSHVIIDFGMHRKAFLIFLKTTAQTLICFSQNLRLFIRQDFIKENLLLSLMRFSNFLKLVN